MQIPDFCFEGLSIQPVTKRLIEHLLAYQPLLVDEVLAFGVDTPRHYQVLQTVVQNACEEVEMVEDEIAYGFCLDRMRLVFTGLDDARESSDKLNRLLYVYARWAVGTISFHTTRDMCLARKDMVS